MPDKIAEWLADIGLARYAARFIDQEIDLDDLSELEDNDLKEIGIPLGPRKRILKAAARFKHVERGDAAAIAASGASEKRTSAWERQPGERKPVTMLFADITGSTALTEHLDAEETHDLVYGAAQLMCEAIEKCGGTVCRFMGDGVMAMFGAPMASEHHAVAACEAALEMERCIHEYSEDIKGRGGSPIRIRVGLHSGEVVVLKVGEGVHAEFDASGPTVPIAARMEQSAEPGRIYLTASTCYLAGSRIETEAVGSLSVKGISERLPAFALQRVRSPEELTWQATRTSFVGRQSELEQLEDIFETCREQRLGRTVYVHGESGIGKTRLVEEFTTVAVGKGAACHRSLVLPFGAGKGQDAIQRLVKSLLGIAPGSNEEQRQRAIEAAIEDRWIQFNQAAFLNDLLGLPQPAGTDVLYAAMDNRARDEGKRDVITGLVTAVSAVQPTVIVIEDVHGAGADTLACLSAISETIHEIAVLLIMTSRTGRAGFERRWADAGARVHFTEIALGPLGEDESMTLMEEFGSSNDSIARACLDRAAGNPFFLEQLLYNAGEGPGDDLPESIQSLILARTDRLEARHKHALQAASVIGQRFDLAALRSLLDSADYDCSELIANDMVRPGEDGFLFAHALIQESVYGSLLKRQRRALHEKTADWFRDRDTVLWARHLDQAGDARAPDAYLQAVDEQTEQYRFEHALDLARRGLEISSQPDRFRFQCLLGELLRVLGSVTESVEAYRQALEMATEDAGRCRACIGVAEGLRIAEQHDELLDVLVDAQDIAARLDLSGELARIHQLRGGVFFMRGKLEACLEENTQSLEYARGVSAGLEVQALSGLGDAELARARMISANRRFDECVELSRIHGLSQSIAVNLAMRGKTRYYLNELEAMLSDAREAVDLAEKIRDQRAEMVALECGVYLADMGYVSEGKAWIELRLEIARRLGSPGFTASSLAKLGNILVQQGNRVEAVKLACEAIEILRQSESSMRFWGPYPLATLALATDDADQRRQALREGRALLRDGSLSLNYFWFYRDAMEVSLQAGEWGAVETYAGALQDYTSSEPLPWSDFYIARGCALAAFGRGRRDEPTIREIQRLRRVAAQVGLETALPELDRTLSSLAND